MRISEAKSGLFNAVVEKGIACSCKVSDTEQPFIILNVNTEADSKRVAEDVLHNSTLYEGYLVEITVGPPPRMWAKIR